MQKGNKKIVVKNKCHSKLDLESSTLVVSQARQQHPAWKILKQVQDDGTNYYNGTKAFTLIELLVVVLIIGILAAVAVPQYQKAVRKSYYAKMLPLLRTVVAAEKAYYLANGEYTDNFDLLDVDIVTQGACGIGGSRGGTCRIPSKNLCICLITDTPGPSVSIGFTWDVFVAGLTTSPSGYEYVLDTLSINSANSLSPGLYCRENNTAFVARTDKHCTGSLVRADWFGSWFRME